MQRDIPLKPWQSLPMAGRVAAVSRQMPQTRNADRTRRRVRLSRQRQGRTGDPVRVQRVGDHDLQSPRNLNRNQVEQHGSRKSPPPSLIFCGFSEGLTFRQRTSVKGIVGILPQAVNKHQRSCQQSGRMSLCDCCLTRVSGILGISRKSPDYLKKSRNFSRLPGGAAFAGAARFDSGLASGGALAR